MFSFKQIGFKIADVERVTQNYDDEVNNKIVQQIQYELKASYMYQAYVSTLFS